MEGRWSWPGPNRRSMGLGSANHLEGERVIVTGKGHRHRRRQSALVLTLVRFPSANHRGDQGFWALRFACGHHPAELARGPNRNSQQDPECATRPTRDCRAMERKTGR